MQGLQYTTQIVDHWKEHQPQKFAELKAAGTLNREAQRVSRQAAERVADLMEAGAQKHEAEEHVRDLLRPAPEA